MRPCEWFHAVKQFKGGLRDHFGQSYKTICSARGELGFQKLS